MSADETPWQKPRFRVFTRGRERRAFKLEPVFWEALEIAAKARGMRLRDLVFELADRNADAANLSSLLRVEAANWLNADAKRQQYRPIAQAALGVLNAAPSAGLVIDEHKRIISHNRAMLDFIQRRRRQSNAQIGEARLVFDLPIEQIFDIVSQASGKLVECGFRLTVNGEPITGRMRVTLFPAPDNAPRQLLAFVIQ